MITRELYLAEIRQFIGTPFIKVLTGLRRCGKSTILEMLREELLASGIAEEAVIFINFEMYDEEELNALDIPRLVNAKKTERVYLLLDEVQLLPRWERAVNAVFAGKKADIFITGSNSRLLSSELATLLAGRYVQFTIRTLSFTEYLDFVRVMGNGAAATDSPGLQSSPQSLFWDYLKQGGFPGIHYLNNRDTALVYKPVSDIFSAVVLKDVIQRNSLRNVDLLERILRFLFDNTGNMVSARSISDYFKSQKRTVSVDTVLEYTAALEGAYSIEKVRRYDIRGRKILNVREKYYSGDIAFIHALLGYDDRRLPGVLENIVYSELRRRGYEAFVGQYDDKEIDFVAVKKNEKLYVQVCYLINNDPAVIDREFGNLLKIKDQHPKCVISLDPRWSSGIEGVQHHYLPDWLCPTPHPAFSGTDR
jgi:predicted AAA+ superfamily ATPase